MPGQNDDNRINAELGTEGKELETCLHLGTGERRTWNNFLGTRKRSNHNDPRSTGLVVEVGSWRFQKHPSQHFCVTSSIRFENLRLLSLARLCRGGHYRKGWPARLAAWLSCCPPMRGAGVLRASEWWCLPHGRRAVCMIAAGP